MITRAFYEEKIREAITLLDSKISRKTIDLVYEKIRDDFENEDLRRAVDDVAELGRLSYPSLLESLRKHASIRRENEAREERQQEKLRIQKFWRENYAYIKDGICNRKCDVCHVDFCDLVAGQALEGIKAILDGRKTLAQVSNEIAKEFHDIGFEEVAYDEEHKG